MELAQLAILAAAGWPLSELWDKPLANLLGMKDLLADGGRAPSVLNGGLGKISPVYWVAVLTLAGAVEAFGMFSASKKEGYFPGNFDFDPLGLCANDVKSKRWMQTAEIKNGQLVMLAITGFAVQEALTHVFFQNY